MSVRVIVWTLLIALAVTLVAAPAVSATAPQKQIVALRRQNATLRAQLRSARALAERRRLAIIDRDNDKSTLQGKIDELMAQVATLTSDKAALTTERDNALLGLPDAIKAVPAGQFSTMVFGPALDARRGNGCGDSYYSSDGYVSYSFNLGKFCY